MCPVNDRRSFAVNSFTVTDHNRLSRSYNEPGQFSYFRRDLLSQTHLRESHSYDRSLQ